MVAQTSISVAHTAEIAHRLYLTPGKCQQIHGHGLQLRLTLAGAVDANGLMCGMDFSSIKRKFRSYVDDALDHQLLLNEKDALASAELPGTRLCLSDPTSENVSRWLAEWALTSYAHPELNKVEVEVRETLVNFAVYSISGYAKLIPPTKLVPSHVFGRLQNGY